MTNDMVSRFERSCRCLHKQILLPAAVDIAAVVVVALSRLPLAGFRFPGRDCPEAEAEAEAIFHVPLMQPPPPLSLPQPQPTNCGKGKRATLEKEARCEMFLSETQEYFSVVQRTLSYEVQFNTPSILRTESKFKIGEGEKEKSEAQDL